MTIKEGTNCVIDIFVKDDTEARHAQIVLTRNERHALAPGLGNTQYVLIQNTIQYVLYTIRLHTDHVYT